MGYVTYFVVTVYIYSTEQVYGYLSVVFDVRRIFLLYKSIFMRSLRFIANYLIATPLHIRYARLLL